MAYPQIPLWGVLVFPLVFIYLIIFTDIRYDFEPDLRIGDATTFASLVVGFILFYAMQKFDNIDLNVPTVARSILYLKKVALKYDANLVCYLIGYVKGFICIDINNYSLKCFEKSLLPMIEDNSERERVRDNVSILEDKYYDRVSETNIIAQPIWYLVFLSGIILSIILPMNSNINKINSILVLLLLWLPIGFIYSLYLTELQSLKDIMNDTLTELEKCTEGIDDYCNSLNCKYKCNPLLGNCRLQKDIDNLEKYR
jgi:hypothetical protein